MEFVPSNEVVYKKEKAEAEEALRLENSAEARLLAAKASGDMEAIAKAEEEVVNAFHATKLITLPLIPLTLALNPLTLALNPLTLALNPLTLSLI